jgi:hypothetical protein
MYIEEILLKEEEKHRLTYIGLIDDWEKAVRMTEKSFFPPDTSFAGRKELLLTVFYSSTLDYEKFIREERTRNACLKKHHFRKTQTYLAALRRERKAPLDEELKTPGDISLAWHFSPALYEEVYGSFCRCLAPLRRPSDTDAFFFGRVGEMYPLAMKQLAERLENGDPSFWDACARYMKGLSRTTAAYVLKESRGSGFSDLIKDQTWTDVYLLMRTRLVERTGRIPAFGNGSDFRNFLIKASRLTAAALQRKYMRHDTCTDDFPANVSCENEDGDDGDSPAGNCTYEMPEDEASVTDINTDNPYEVASAVSMVLLDSAHPLYKPLTEGIEDKVRILIDRAVNGMSYQEIVSGEYSPESPGGADFQKAVARARKDCERVRKTLCGRMKEIAEKKTWIHVTNQASPA